MSAVARTKRDRQRWSFLIEERTPEEIFTPEDFTEEHRMIADTTRQFIDNEVMPRIDELEKHDWKLARELVKKAADLGLIGANIPEEYGGLGLDQTSGALIGENIGRSASFATTLGAESGIGLLPIIYFGTEAAKQKYLPKIAAGELITAYALTEAGSGSDAMAAKATARLSEDGTQYILNGEKMFITNGGFADIFIVFAKVDGDKFTAFIVERQEGCHPGAEEHKMGIKGSSTTPLVLSDAKTPVENLLGEVGKGHKIAFNILNIGRFKLGAMCVGGMKLMVHEVGALRERAPAVWQTDLFVRRDQVEARRDGDSHLGGRGDDLSHAGNDRRRRSRDTERSGCEAESDRGVLGRVFDHQGRAFGILRLRRRRDGPDLRRLRLLRRLSGRARLSRLAHQSHLRRHERNQSHVDSGPLDEERA